MLQKNKLQRIVTKKVVTNVINNNDMQLSFVGTFQKMVNDKIMFTLGNDWKVIIKHQEVEAILNLN